MHTKQKGGGSFMEFIQKPVVVTENGCVIIGCGWN